MLQVLALDSQMCSLVIWDFALLQGHPRTVSFILPVEELLNQ